MRTSGIRGLTVAAASAAALLGAGSAAWSKDITIKMAVPDWPPTRIMQDLANESYKATAVLDVGVRAAGSA